MAEIITGTSQTYAGTAASSSKIVGVNGGLNYVARYQFSSDAKGANKVSWELTENYKGSGSVPPLRWYITTSASSHINAGSSAAYHGAVTVTEYGGSYIFSGSADIVLKPSTIYYLWIFPNTTTYGFYWLAAKGTATVTTSGAALSVLSVSGTKELGKTLTLAVTRYSNTFTHTITYKCGSASGTICTKDTDTSLSFVPPVDLAKQNTTGTSVSITFSTATYDGNALIGTTTKTISCAIPASVKPSCVVTVTDPTGNADFYGDYIKGISKFAVTITPTTAQGSPIASYKATANGATYVKASFTTDLLQTDGNLVVSATVTDKRGRSGSDSETLTVIDYIPPSITKLKVKRCDADGTENDQGEYVQVTFDASATPLNDKNTTTYVLEYKKATETSYTAVTLTDFADSYSVTDGTYIFEADTGATYEIKLTLTDAFNGVWTSTVASTAFTIMHFKADGTGMAIGKVSEEPNLLDIALDVKFRGNVDGEFFKAKLVDITEASQTSYTLNWLYAYARSGIIDLHFSVSPTESATSWITVATLPEGYRPPQNIYKDMPYWNATSGNAHLRMRITTAGLIQFNRGSSGVSYAFHDTFIMA